MLNMLIPTPKKIEVAAGKTNLAGFRIALSASCDSRVCNLARKLASELSAETHTEITLTKVLGEPALDGFVNVIAGDGCGEGYTLSANGKSVTVRGASLAGAFYGIQTLRQLAKDSRGLIPNVEIEDAPDMSYRGMYQDITRGRVPTVESTKEFIDLLAYYKINSLQFYIEHTFMFEEYVGIAHKENCITASEIMELDDYCYENFIDFVPSLSTFGHLYRLLDDPKWHEYCELDKYEKFNNPWHNAMAHHTIDPSNPGSIEIIKSMINQYAPLFRSKYFNICCDETFDLGQGRNKGKDTGKLYLEFTGKIIAHVQSLGKTVMMWGDIILHHPEIMDSFSKDVVMLNWSYTNNPDVTTATKFRDSGFRQVLCPGTSCWNQMAEHVNFAEQNIIKMIKSGHDNGAMGALNTAWGDYGHTCPITSTMYGIVLGAAISWNKDERVACKEFDDKIAWMIYGDKTGKSVQLLRRLGDSEGIVSWSMLVNLYFNCKTWQAPNQDTAQLAEAAKIALSVAEGLRALPVQNKYVTDLTISAEGQYLIAMSVARYAGSRKKVPAGFTDDWCKRYAESWRRDNKESELFKVLDVFRNCK